MGPLPANLTSLHTPKRLTFLTIRTVWSKFASWKRRWKHHLDFPAVSEVFTPFRQIFTTQISHPFTKNINLHQKNFWILYNLKMVIRNAVIFFVVSKIFILRFPWMLRVAMEAILKFLPLHLYMELIFAEKKAAHLKSAAFCCKACGKCRLGELRLICWGRRDDASTLPKESCTYTHHI